ncbi:MAG: YdcF family protein [Acidimicrobiales bacterium]
MALLVAVALVIYLLVTFAQVWMTSGEDQARKAGAIVVLGAAQYNGVASPVLKARVTHAAELYRQGLAPVVVVTGGRREGDRYTEASVAAGVLIQLGVPESALRLEAGGVSSWQSLAATARFLKDEGIKEVLLVSSPYHSLRVKHIAGEVGLKGYASPTRDDPEDFAAQVTHLARETLAVGAGRIIGYRRLFNLDEA